MPKNYLFVEEDEEIFCSSVTKYFGQPVGIILAESMELANHAAEMVHVSYNQGMSLKTRN